MQSSTMPLFEREIRAQVEAARLAAEEAERRDDVLLAEAARAHLDSLVSLARRNGIDVTAPAVVEGPELYVDLTPSLDLRAEAPRELRRLGEVDPRAGPLHVAQRHTVEPGPPQVGTDQPGAPQHGV